MPESGPVVETRSEGSPDDQAGTFIDAKPPQQGDSATDIVTGFLEAMTATPIDLNVAREFLTRDAEAAWDPDARTITYAEVIGPLGSGTLTVDLAGAEHLDQRGAFLGSLPRDERTLTLPDASGERAVADRRRPRRAGRPGDVVRAGLQPRLALLLRPVGADPRARAGVRAVR